MRILKEQGRVPIHLWDGDGVQIEPEAMAQIRNVASLPVVGPHVAIMPDAHWGNGACVGSVIPTKAAIIPAAVGVDLGCGMRAVQTDLSAADLPTHKLHEIRAALEQAIPVGGPGEKGSWTDTPREVEMVWEREFEDGYARIVAKDPLVARRHPPYRQLGTLGTGNHFIEACASDDGWIWFMLHSGSRGVGNGIGTYFIEQAKEQALRLDRTIKTDVNLAWLDEGTKLFDDYVEALMWAQRYAARNRDLMMGLVIKTVRDTVGPFHAGLSAIDVHHNYVEERRGGLYITRKGAVSAQLGQLGIIPGSMGTKSYIVRGLGNPESFESCSHGAGRRMSRGAAKRTFTLEDLERQTRGVECRKDAGIIDELPGAYKDLDAVMAAQSDLVEIVATLKVVISVKG